ncbi:hypothetical protein BJY04DRAFT_217530 [Aspergillus karnatakaensis]|uniref:uncharacterized protein n=1 Tax=Aspergillus karnatakaensis TaxID=1810916 RepID=UPI003CCDA0AB
MSSSCRFGLPGTSIWPSDPPEPVGGGYQPNCMPLAVPRRSASFFDVVLNPEPDHGSDPGSAHGIDHGFDQGLDSGLNPDLDLGLEPNLDLDLESNLDPDLDPGLDLALDPNLDHQYPEEATATDLDTITPDQEHANNGDCPSPSQHSTSSTESSTFECEDGMESESAADIPCSPALSHQSCEVDDEILDPTFECHEMDSEGEADTLEAQGSGEEKPSFAEPMSDLGSDLGYMTAESTMGGDDDTISPDAGFEQPATISDSESVSNELRCYWNNCTYDGIFLTLRARTQHIRMCHLASSTLTCSRAGCEEVFGSIESLEEHHKSKHQLSLHLFQCPFPDCGTILIGKNNKHGHMRTHRLTPGSFKCSEPGCGVAYKHRANLRRHVRQAHRNIVANVSSPTTADNALSADPKSAHQRVAFKCTKRGCGHAFEMPSILQRHESDVHYTPRKCPEAGCSKVYKTITGLNYHVNSFHLKTVHKCPEAGCGGVYNSYYHLKTHLRTVHKKKG